MTEKKSLFSRLREGLFKSREHMSVAMEAAVQDDRPIDEDFYDDLLDALILSDMGATCATEAIDRLRERVKAEHLRYAPQARDALKGILVEMLEVEKPALHWPMVTLMVGVNGVGKTTTIGKLALRFQGLGRTIILCAADTFRAAAAEQLQVWADRARLPHRAATRRARTPPAWCSTAYRPPRPATPTCSSSIRRAACTTKRTSWTSWKRCAASSTANTPRRTVRCLLVVDATTGQNGLAQARAFREAAGIDGIVLTKLDGTAKGGIAFSIVRELGVPVMYVGVGEGIEDLQSFNAREFVDALFE